MPLMAGKPEGIAAGNTVAVKNITRVRLALLGARYWGAGVWMDYASGWIAAKKHRVVRRISRPLPTILRFSNSRKSQNRSAEFQSNPL